MLKQATSHKPQATSHKPQAFRLGFTLSELLVSLAVLGLIAGLTVPSIVTSVRISQNKTKLKEAFQTISSIVSNGVLNGDFSNITSWDIINQNGAGSITNYISNQLNYSKQCLTADTTSIGCVSGGFPDQTPNSSFNAHNGRWILPNGVCIQITNPGWMSSNYLAITIKAEGSKSTYTSNDAYGTNPSAISVQCNLTDTTQAFMNGVVVKSGSCYAGQNAYAFQPALDRVFQ